MTKRKYEYLDAINSPADLRKLSIDELPKVCQELRQDIIDEVSVNPGHFASSLGVVEITVALHYVLILPTTALYGTSATRPMAIRSLPVAATDSIPTASWAAYVLSQLPWKVLMTRLPADMPPTPSPRLSAWP